MSSRRQKRAPGTVDARAVAGAAMRNWDLVQSRLAPIIGQDGFRVLFARSLHRARVEHAWLARDTGKSGPLFAALEKSIESEPPERAADGSRALVTHFNELLNALIGAELAARLTGPVPGAAGRTTQEFDR